jgi:ribA/ribD-fused uncharacterized protein
MKDIVGNILDVKKGIICHQVNCMKVAGGGLAWQIRNKWPGWYTDYYNTRPALGRCFLYDVQADLIVANLYGQYGFGGRGVVWTDYIALAAAVRELRHYVRWQKVKMITEFQGEYRFLSNFWPCEVEYDGMIYPSVEHAYQAAKTLDIVQQSTIQHASTPGLAKKMGRKVTMRRDWDKIKLGVMENLVRQKFKNAKLKKQLLSTGTRILVEGNNWGDRYWGVSPVENGYGLNHLGKILMKVRDEL